MWSIHLLNARGKLAPLEGPLRAALLAARQRLEAAGPPLDLDILIGSADQPMPQSMLVGGAAFGPGRIELTIDTTRDAPWGILQDELLKTLFHEYHHAIRWDGPGYGKSLGEALVSEGLAQVFVHEMMDCAPEPWEVALAGQDIGPLCRRAHAEFDDAHYSHDAWFFGTGDLPRWAGYHLARTLAERHIALEPGRSALSLANEPASRFRDTLLTCAQR